MFAYPYDKGRNNATVVNTVAKYYTLARSGNEPLMYLHCNNFKSKVIQTDCRPFSESGKTTFANIYSVIGWSHDYERKIHSYNDSKMYNRFTQVVDSQTDFNKDGIINAIPIIIYHRIDNSREDYSTTISLFDAEMQYLHNNNFKVLTLVDLGYEQNDNHLYLKN